MKTPKQPPGAGSDFFAASTTPALQMMLRTSVLFFHKLLVWPRLHAGILVDESPRFMYGILQIGSRRVVPEGQWVLGLPYTPWISQKPRICEIDANSYSSNTSAIRCNRR